MSSQSVGRGFHRLAVFLAAIPLLVGTVISLYWAGGPTFTDLTRHKRLVCEVDDWFVAILVRFGTSSPLAIVTHTIGSLRATTEEHLHLLRRDFSVLVGIDRLEDFGMGRLEFLERQSPVAISIH